MSVQRKVTTPLSGGEIIALNNDGIVHACGIRYASATRFHKPEDVTTWSTTQDCTHPAPECPQATSRLAAVIGDVDANRTQSEDCLRVSVDAPYPIPGQSSEKLPVVVFLHGGAYVAGGGDNDAYGPSGLARQGQVVAVTVTYRLGMLGYLPIPSIAPANLGLLDQMSALRWIQRNVQGYGGDPSRVTVFGQSAGGDSIYCLLVADDTKDLFHRCITQSNPLGRVDEDDTEMTAALSQHASRALAGKNPQTVPIETILELHQELIGVGRSKSSLLLQYAPVFGEYPLPSHSQLSERFAAVAKEKAIFMGYCANDDTAFTLIDPWMSTAYLQNQFQGAVDRLIEQVESETGIRIPSYVMAWHPEGNSLLATHFMELPLLLGNWTAWKDAPMLKGPRAREVIQSLCVSAKNLWLSFAKGQDLQGQKLIIDEHFYYE